MKNMQSNWKWEVGDDIVNFTNYKARIEQRLIDEQGKPCYLVSSNDDIDYENGEEDKKWILAEEEVMCLEKDYEGQDCENILELNDEDRKELARLVYEGNTSGRLDGEDDDGNATSLTWELRTLKWHD